MRCRECADRLLCMDSGAHFQYMSEEERLFLINVAKPHTAKTNPRQYLFRVRSHIAAADLVQI